MCVVNELWVQKTHRKQHMKKYHVLVLVSTVMGEDVTNERVLAHSPLNQRDDSRSLKAVLQPPPVF